MIKKFRLTIDLEAIIPDKITAELVEKVVAEVDKSNTFPIYQPQIDKHQAFIDYIKNNDNLHEQCIAADLFFKLTEHGLEDELAELLKPKSFDEIALDAAKELDSESGHFITQLYGDDETKNNDDKIDEDGNPLPDRMSKKEALEALKREINRLIIQDNLLDYKLTTASVKTVKNDSPQME